MQQNTSRSKASPAQLSYLAEYMKSHCNMASGLSQNLQGRAHLESMWQELTTKLNSLGGPIKTVAKWKQAWRDLKNNVKKKASHNHIEFRGYGPGSTGNGPSRIKEMTQVEEQVLSVMGPVAVYGMEDIMSTEIKHHAESPGPSQSIAPVPLPAPEPNCAMGPLPVLPRPVMGPEPGAAAPSQRKRRRVVARHDSFDKRLLEIEEEKIKIKRERNSIEKEKVAVLARLVDVLQDITNK